MACNHHDFDANRKLKFAIAFTSVVLVAEVAGGFYTNSLALLSDAAHVFMDLFSLVLSLTALYLAARPVSDTRTYGWHRAEVFAAFVNGVTLILIAVGIFYECYERFVSPQAIKTVEMMAIAFLGMVANLVVVLKLKGHNHRDLNVHSAFLHVAGDFLSSVGVVAGGAVMYFTGWFVVDPLLSAAIGLLILYGSIRLVRESVHILLEGVPKGIDVADVADAVRGVEGVRDVHHLRIWSICSNILALSAHVLVNHQKASDSDALVRRVNEMLATRFGITDTTLQVDTEAEERDALLKEIQHPEEPHERHEEHEEHEAHVDG